MRRPAQRISRVLLPAVAVPVILAAAGCSSDSDTKDSTPEESASASASKAAGVEKFSKLPDPCKAYDKDLLKDLVPEASHPGGDSERSQDVSRHAGCTWSSLDNKGVDGSQFRWLALRMDRYTNEDGLPAPATQAHERFSTLVSAARKTEGASKLQVEPVAGMGEEATLVSFQAKEKDDSTGQRQTLVVRTGNVVVKVDYNGTGLAGQKTPGADKLAPLAKKAAKEAVTAVEEAPASGKDDGGKEE